MKEERRTPEPREPPPTDASPGVTGSWGEEKEGKSWLTGLPETDPRALGAVG